jgi:DNA-binding XRE family transcriptional regulator
MAQRTGRPRGLTPDGPKIRRLRVGLGLSAAQLAPRVGLHPKTVMAIESTSRPVSDVTASRIARALGVSMSDITDYDTGSDVETKIPA